MKDRTIVITVLLIVIMTLSSAVRALAFYHPNGTEDYEFEIFGPRLDRIQFMKYSSLDAEIAALQGGEIDITDWALTPALEAQLTGDPNIVMLNYGDGTSYYTLNMNCNNNTCLGNPPDPAFPNPALPNPTADVWFRRALSYCINNSALASINNGYDSIYTPIPAYMASWINPDIMPGSLLEALTYPYDLTYFMPSMLLDANNFPIDPGSLYRYYDMNENGVLDTGEAFTLRVYTRADPVGRVIGDQEEAGLIALRINYIRSEVNSAQAREIVKVQKNYHTYTEEYVYVGPNPDYLYDLYSYDNYYHDGVSAAPNYAAIGKYDPVNEDTLTALKYAQNEADALDAALDFQLNFATMAFEKPCVSTGGVKAFNKWYTGGNDGVIKATDDGENQYRGDNWDDIVNQAGFGVNSFWSTLSMFPVGHEWGDGQFMTVREGWSVDDQPGIVNPVYSTSYWEWEILGRVYDPLFRRNPYTQGPPDIPQLAENCTVGTWTDPADGITKRIITVGVRPDVLWNDGVQFTIDDLIFTLIMMPGELRALGCADPRWQSTTDQIAGYFKLDNYTVAFLMKSNSIFAADSITTNLVLPKHWWQPFLASHPPEVIQGDIGPEMLVGTGPFLYVDNTHTSIDQPTDSTTLRRRSTYYQPVQLQSGIEFTANFPSTQISPVRIRDANVSFIGPDGWFTARVTVSNLNTYQSVTFDETITITYAGPNAPGTPMTLLSTSSRTLASGATFVYTQALRVRDGLHRVDVTVQRSGGVASTSTRYVWITVAGDLTGDWSANILDISQIAIRFGSIRGDTRYDPIADVNRDNKINILDIVQVALVFGWTAIGP